MDYYKILEVREDASQDVIAMAYKALVRKYHPDTYKGDMSYATEKMKEINEAYEVLRNPISKKQYDEERREKNYAFNDENENNRSPQETNIYVYNLDASPLPVKWFKFYVHILLPILVAFHVFYSIIPSFKEIPNLIQDHLPSYLMLFMLFLIAFIVIEIVYTVLLILTAIGMRSLKKWSEVTNFASLAIYPSLAGVGVIFDKISRLSGYNYSSDKLYISVFIASMVPLLISSANIVYFAKRDFLFLGDSVVYDDKRTGFFQSIRWRKTINWFVVSLILVLIISILSQPFLGGVVENFAEWDETETELTYTDYEIAVRVNSMSMDLGFSSFKEMYEEVTGQDDYEKLTMKERIDTLASASGLPVYREALWHTNPYTYEYIDGYMSYISYFHDAINNYWEFAEVTYSNKEIQNKVDEMAYMYGYPSFDDMFIEWFMFEEKSFLSLPLKSKIDYFADDLGLASYNEALGYLNPYTSEQIVGYFDYIDYISLGLTDFMESWD